MAIHHQVKTATVEPPVADDDLDFEFTTIPGDVSPAPVPTASPEAATDPDPADVPVEAPAEIPQETAAQEEQYMEPEEPALDPQESESCQDEPPAAVKPARATGRTKGTEAKATKKTDLKRTQYRTSLYLSYELADDVDTYRRKLRRSSSAVETSLSNVFVRAMEDKLYRSYRCSCCDLIFSVASEGNTAIIPSICPVCSGNIKLHRFTR